MGFCVVYDVTKSQSSYRFGTDTSIKCQFDKQSSPEIGKKHFHEGEWHSKQQMPPNSEQKWRSDEPIISDKNRNYPVTISIRSRMTRTTSRTTTTRGILAENHPTAAANQITLNNIPRERPEQWAPCFPYKLKQGQLVS